MKIIYLLLDAISYEHSWLSNENYMPNLKNITENGINFHNHYSVTHNTRGNLAAMLYGASSSITGVMGRKQSFRDSGLKSLQKELNENNFISAYVGTQPLTHGEKHGDKLDFDECLYLSPSMSDFYIPAENFNNILKTKLTQLKDNSLTFFHYTDCHEPYETPENILSKKEYPLLHKFHYRLSNILFRIPRKIYRNYFSLKNLKKKFKVYNEFKYISKLCLNPYGSIKTPERYSWFYEKVWEDKNYYNEYKKMMFVTLTYLDKHVGKIINHIKDYHSDNTLIFISSDHGNNGVISPEIKKKNGLLSKNSTHIPLSVISFDENLKKKIIHNNKNITNYTSHVNFYKSILHLINPKKYNYKNETIFSKNAINEFVISEINDTRFDFGECVIRKRDKEIHLKVNKSDNINSLKLIQKKDLINDVPDQDYQIYCDFKKNYNLNFFN